MRLAGVGRVDAVRLKLLAWSMVSAALCACTAASTGTSPAMARTGTASATPTFDGVRQKGFVQCGVTTGVAGFSALDALGEWHGLDVDVCRAIAAAVLGDARRVHFTPLTAAQRFAALQSGEIDVLARITTVTFSATYSSASSSRPSTGTTAAASSCRAPRA